MDFCGHLMRECHQKKEFMQPKAALKLQPDKNKELTFDEKENRVNLRRCQKKQFYDGTMCRHLCSSSLVLKSKRITSKSSCEEICFELTKSSESSGEICPYQKYCPNGCPCKHYDCEKLSKRDQENLPVWDLMSETSRKAEDTKTNVKIFERREDLKRLPETFGFNVLLYDYNSKNISDEVFIKSDALFPHERIKNYKS